MVGTGFVFWEYEKALECSETEVETLSVLDKVGGLQWNISIGLGQPSAMKRKWRGYEYWTRAADCSETEVQSASVVDKGGVSVLDKGTKL